VIRFGAMRRVLSGCVSLARAKADEWANVVKIGRTHMQDATPITLGEEWSGYVGMFNDNLERIENALKGVYSLALGGTAVGTGINAAPGFGEAAAAEIGSLRSCLSSARRTSSRRRALMMVKFNSPGHSVLLRSRSTKLLMTFG
jgi:fumarate hydratase class II